MNRLLKNKVKEIKGLAGTVERLKSRHKKIVFTNGCFDLLHYGHIKYLQDAKRNGDILVVGVNSDASVRRIKGANRPIVKEKDRVRLVASLESVDYAVLFREDTPIKLIKAIRPDVLIKGSDWKKKDIVGGDFVARYGGKIRRIGFIKGYSTSNLIKKIAGQS